MANRPDKKPRWATVPTINGVTGKNNVIEPTEGKKDLGWDYLEKPARNFLNWVMNKAYEWIDYFDKNSQFLVIENDPIPDMSVIVQRGSYLKQGAILVDLAGSTQGLIVAPTVNPRIDMVVLNRLTDIISVITGAENASPVPPVLVSNETPLGSIFLIVGQTSIVNSDLTDERVLWEPTLFSSTTESGVVELATDTETFNRVDTFRAITPSNLNAIPSTVTDRGLIRVATTAEAQAYLLDDAAISPLKLLEARAASSVAGFSVGRYRYMSTDTHSGTAMDVSGSLPQLTWESVGPTGSGASNIWTALDLVPLSAVAIIVTSYLVVEGSLNSAYALTITVEKTGYNGSAVDKEVHQVAFLNTSASLERIIGKSEVTIPIDSTNGFQLRYNPGGNLPTSTVSLYLKGFSLP